MSEIKHTSGSWTAMPEECDKPYIRIRGTRLGGRYKIANVMTPVYEGVPNREAIETRANAHLIAAAPDLYFALSNIIEGLPNNKDWLDPDIERFARAAIAKARSQP